MQENWIELEENLNKVDCLSVFCIFSLTLGELVFLVIQILNRTFCALMSNCFNYSLK